MPTSDIIQDGKPHFGIWFGDIHHPDPRGFRPSFLSQVYLPFREKRWQYIGVYTEEVFLGLAVVHARYVGNVFCYVFDRSSKVLWEQERIAPLGAGIRIARETFSGVTSYNTEHERVRIEARGGHRVVDVRLKEKNQDLDVRLELEDTPQPLQIVTPTSSTGFTFTHKGAALRTFGSIRLGNKRWTLEDEKSALDMTFGYPAHKTSWQWLSVHGVSKENLSIAINLVAPIFHDRYQENVIWIDQKAIPLSAVEFSFSPEDPMAPWHIKSQDGALSLTFTPEGLRRQDLSYPVLASKFIQPFGTCSGSFKDKEGRCHTFDSLSGVVEDHHARW